MQDNNALVDILENFIKDNAGSAIQGSKKWIEERRHTIGGSEIAAVIGCNAFSNLQGLIAQKVNLTSFKGNSATRWGNLFENISELLFKTIFLSDNDKIYATGSIQHKTIKNHKYSPDGLCILPFLDNKKIEKKITLLEFKSPYGSVPTAKVPKHYLPQVKAGMCTIDICETAVFVNNMFRKCSLNQLDFTTSYNSSYHRDTELKLKRINKAIANGMILFSISAESLPLFVDTYNDMIDKKYFNDDASDDSASYNPDKPNKKHKYSEFTDDICDNNPDTDLDSDIEDDIHIDDGTNILYKVKAIIEDSTKNLIDFGEENKEMFDQFLSLYKPDDNEPGYIDIKCIKPQLNKAAFTQASAKYSTLILPNELGYVCSNDHLSGICKKYNFEKIIKLYKNKCTKNGAILIGYLPWKLFRSSNIIVDKEPDFLENIKDKIDNTVDIINDIMSNSSDLDEVANNFEKHFADSSIIKKYYEDKAPSTEYIMDFL